MCERPDAEEAKVISITAFDGPVGHTRVECRFPADLSHAVQRSAASRSGQIAFADYALRQLVAVLGPSYSHQLGPYVFERNDARFEAGVCLHLEVTGLAEDVSVEEIRRAVESELMCVGASDHAADHCMSVLDQQALRAAVERANGVAFVANGSILPRRSAVDDRPLELDAVVPFQCPPSLERSFELPSGRRVSGLFLPKGVSLIVGGAFHGKSTFLRALAAGVYDKVPGDGREFVVTDASAVTLRAEDGRPVSTVDISAFVGALPRASGLEPKKFSASEASGSTSQAANLLEALECGCRALLVDEDMSAANFMVRDGRMRALVAHEPLTPLLYRASGLSDLGVSSVIAVGGCGDWLDIGDTVVLLDDYIASDATARAHSVSKRFSHGHVQFAGRGTAHRLPWPGDPAPRVPVAESMRAVLDASSRGEGFPPSSSAAVGLALRELGPGLLAYGSDTSIDLRRCEQILGGSAQLFGIGLCLSWLARRVEVAEGAGAALSVPSLLDELEAAVDADGFGSFAARLGWRLPASRPRRYEVAGALHRLRGVRFATLS